MIEIKKQIADKIGYEKHPYDALLDSFEEDLTVDPGKGIRCIDSTYSEDSEKTCRFGSQFCKESNLGKSKMISKELMKSIMIF